MSSKTEIDEPLNYFSGKVTFSEQLKAEPAFRAVVPLLDHDKQKAKDLGIYLFFVHDPRSIYRKMAQEDRLMNLIREGRVANKEWLVELVQTEEMQMLIHKYQEVSMTPGERLYEGMISNINRYLKELSLVRGDDGTIDHIKLVEKGQKLFESLEKIEAMKTKESQKKTRGGYQQRKFETPQSRSVSQF